MDNNVQNIARATKMMVLLVENGLNQGVKHHRMSDNELLTDIYEIIAAMLNKNEGVKCHFPNGDVVELSVSKVLKELSEEQSKES